MSEPIQQPSLPAIQIDASEVFPGTPGGTLLFDSGAWDSPITYFVGRNGSGKSRTAKLIANRLGGRLLSTDRLAGLMTYTNYGWTSVPSVESHRGIPLGDQERNQARSFAMSSGMGIEEMYALKEEPAVWLRVAAFLRRALGRVIELRERSGFMDPYIRVGNIDYSLLRDEGHGLRELLVLLTAVYRRDWSLLVVDEPELHLHPSMTRLWMSELERECRDGRRAIVVTHEPSLVNPKTSRDLRSLWHFAPGRPASPISAHVLPVQEDRVTSSLRQNGRLVSQLVFSPRPVLVEGVDDAAALATALSRTQPPEVVAQTELVECGGSGSVALWFEIARKLELDVRAVADLDACFAPEVQRSLDSSDSIRHLYRTRLHAEPPRTSAVLQPLLSEMGRAGVSPDPKARSRWLATNVPAETGWAARKDVLLEIWQSVGLWLHPHGTLEDVLRTKTKGRESAETAALSPGPIDDVAAWCAYDLDQLGDVEVLLNAAVERIAHAIMEALRVNPGTEFIAPVGASAATDARLVDVIPLGAGGHRLVVKEPAEFAGYSLEFSRDTPSSALTLSPPESALEVGLVP